MKKIIYCLLSGLILLSLPSCKDFLEVKPKGVILPEKLLDYENMLNSLTMTQTYPSPLLYSTDDYYGDYKPVDKSIDANMFYWREEIDINDQVSPAMWGQLYRVIYDANVIINNVMNAKDGEEQKKRSVLGEALLIRADAYFNLLTIYAKAYNPATAATDLGLPMVVKTDVTDKAPARSTLQATLDDIINNTVKAITDLPVNNLNRYRGTKAAAQGFLSRVYLYIGDYPNAAKYANLAIQASHRLIDYNAITSRTGIPVSDLNPEVLWQRACNDYSVPTFMLYSDDLKSYFDFTLPAKKIDLRATYLTGKNAKGIYRSSPPGRANFGVTFPELYLNLAEVAARENNIPKAIELVDKIRKVRIFKDVYVASTAATPEAALTLVLKERRMELAYGGLRWSDMKRLDKEGRMPPVQRINRTTGEFLGTLQPHSKQYTFQIPTRVRRFNPTMETN